MRSDAFRTATARQIGREFAGLDPGPGFDITPSNVPMPAVSVDEINWSPSPVATIVWDGSPLRASTIAYRELAQAACHALYDLQQRHDRLLRQHYRLRDELKAQSAPSSLPIGNSEPRPARKQTRFPLSGIAGVRGVSSGVRGL